MRAIERRRGMNSGRGLPYDYEVEYLERTTTQYIDLGFKPGNTHGFEVRFMKFDDAEDYVIGAWNGWNSNMWAYDAKYSSNQHLFCYAGASGYYYNNVKNSIVKVEMLGGNFKIDGVSKRNQSSSAFTANGNVLLFSINNNNTPALGKSRLRIYSCRIFQNSTSNVILDLIPVCKNNTGYMYDKISGQLFGNAGTGVFTMGANKNTLPYDYEVEYLQSSGTQYINTGIMPSSDLIEVSATVKIPNFSGSGAIMEVYGDGGIRYYALGKNGYFYTLNFSGTWSDSKQASIASSNFNSTDFFTVTSQIGNSQCKLSTSNGKSASCNYAEGWSGNDYPFYIFGRNVTNVRCDAPASIYLKALTISKAGTLVRDYIPVSKDGVGYLYDRVSGQLFGNVGTGSFTMGARVN